MTCDSCVKSVSDALFSLDGITSVDANLKDELVAVKGTGKIRIAREQNCSCLLVGPVKGRGGETNR